jgi:RND family efflux transporter MFP subunit
MTSPSASYRLTAARLIVLGALVGSIAGCSETPPPAATAPRQVAVALAAATTTANIARLTGEVQAANEAELGFRIGGKVVERKVDVGDKVVAGQVLAKLDSVNEENALKAAKAVRLAALGEVEQTRSTFDRQDRLMSQGFTTRRQFDQALTAKEVAEARLNEAEAQVALAQDRLGFTELRTDSDGVVTTRRLEAGEVVQPGQVVFRLARDDGRDAVFDVTPRFLDQQPAGGIFRVSLATDPNVAVTGRVREIAPQADAATGTFRIRVGLDKKLPAMALGSTVVGVLEKSSALVVSVPASALTIVGTDPAVWVVDQATSKVTLRRIEVLRFEYATVMVAHGLEAGEMVVSGGIQALYPGQIIKALPSAERRADSRKYLQATAACLDGASGFAISIPLNT